jgi:hypothetical protein
MLVLYLISGEKKPQSPFVSMLLTLNQENNLVKQNYRCAGCSSSIGLIYGPARVCNFSGGLYCSDCHTDNDEVIIPARVFLNGDWSKRKVCRAVRQFFQDIEVDPILDTTQFDRNIYSYQREFAALLTVRTQLQHLSAFLLTCRTAVVGEEFRKRTYSKEYLYSQQHSYSLADLPLIQSGQLHQQLTKLFQYGKLHVGDCCLCSMKGVYRLSSFVFSKEMQVTFFGFFFFFKVSCVKHAVWMPSYSLLTWIRRLNARFVVPFFIRNAWTASNHVQDVNVGKVENEVK